MTTTDQTQSQSFPNRTAVSIQFTGDFTQGLMLPRVSVFQDGQEIHFDIGPTVVPNRCSMPWELIIPEKQRYHASPLWRSVKRYLTASVFIPSVGRSRYAAEMYEDHKGHHHILFDNYDFAMLSAFAAFLRIHQERRAGTVDSIAIAAAIAASDKEDLFSGLLSPEFVDTCCSLLTRFQLPYSCEQELDLRLVSVKSSALELRRSAGLEKVIVPPAAIPPASGPRPSNRPGSFVLAATSAGATLAQLRASLVGGVS